jgi:hypothetical protein
MVERIEPAGLHTVTSAQGSPVPLALLTDNLRRMVLIDNTARMSVDQS